MSASVAVIIVWCSVLATTPALNAASAGTVVSAQVPSASTIDASGCPPRAGSITDFGAVLPGSSATTLSDCVVAFGSSNDTARLTATQLDRRGSAMWQYTSGTPDASWGTAGVVKVPVGTGDDDARAIHVQDDGKLLVAGTAFDGSVHDLALVRLDPNGALDATFGTGGVIIDHIPGNHATCGVDVAQQPDGKILVNRSDCGGAHRLYRYEPDGTIDATFGTGGYVDTWRMSTIQLQDDGKILVAGFGANMHVQRFLADGSPDNSFGSAGGANFAIGTGGSVARDIEVLPDGKILLFGYAELGGIQQLAVVRLTSGGTLDATFGTAGVAMSVPNGLGAAGWAGAVQPDGRILVGGQVQDGIWTGLGLTRFLADGTVDTSFGSGGSAWIAGAGVLNVHVDRWADLQLQDDGMVLLTGTGGNQGAAVRYTPTGQLDTSFGGSGTGWFRQNPADFTRGTFGHDGTLYVVGRTLGVSDLDFTIARFESEAIADHGIGTWSAGANMFGACLRALTGASTSPTWSVNATCPAADGVWWNDVPAAEPGGAIGSTTVAGAIGTANLRFGLRVSTNQRPGSYQAPVALTVVAPST